MDPRTYKIALSLLRSIGVVKTKILISKVTNIASIFELEAIALAEKTGLKPAIIEKLERKAAIIRAEQELDWMDKNGVKLHYYQDNNYPSALKFCQDGPIVLFSKGNIDFKQRNIAIVGMRKSTAYGAANTKALVKDLAPRNVQIVSGLAHGIDREAHIAALENGLNTIAVLGHGLDLIYPAAHKNLAKQIMKQGGLLTEYLSFTPGDPALFPQRNRIVAGLSDATVVVESGITGGSFITANLAIDYNREVFAFPGNVGQASSAGCNHLIRSEKAHLITCAEDMNKDMNWDETVVEEEPLQIDIFEELSVAEAAIVAVIKAHTAPSMHIDEIGREVTCTASELSLHLFNLQMRETLVTAPGGQFRLK